MFIERENNKVKLIKLVLVILIFAVFSIYHCFSDEIEIIELSSEIWSGQKMLEGNYILPNKETITIEKGTEIIFKENTRITLDGGIINAIGTEKEPIIFRSFSGNPNGYYIRADDLSGIYFKNVDISGGGFVAEEPPVELITLIKKARAQFAGYGVLTVSDPAFFILDKCDIHDNSIGILIGGARKGSFVQVNRSRFFDNTNYSVVASGGSEISLDFQYNWWQSDDQDGLINDLHKKTRKDFNDPLIVVPGIMGSTKKEGEWQLDLILHTYDDLVESLIKAGYVRGVDLFVFPYEWRDSNIDNAILLKDRIQEIKNQTSSNRVDIVAHSMGGLLAREYLESDYYQDDIDQLITLGTPHLGASKSYSACETGRMGVKFEDKIIEKYLEYEAKKNGFDSLYNYIHNRPIASVQELLPVYNYLWNKDLDQQKIYPTDYPRNNFLENLNKNEKVGYLAGIEFDNIIGTRGNTSTIASYKVTESENDYWQHGYPDDFNSIFGDRGIVYGPGDETVPLSSASFPDQYSQYVIELNSKHTDLPTDSQQDVIELLSGIRPVEKIDDSLIKNMLFISVFSPIDILITLADGRRIGTDPETGEVFNEIEGAYYSGNETDTEFITIPNYEDMEYQISVKGTDDGDFRVEVTSFEDLDGEVTETQLEEWQGTVIKDEIQDFDFVIGEIAITIEPESEDDSETVENSVATTTENEDNSETVASSVVTTTENMDSSGLDSVSDDAQEDENNDEDEEDEEDSEDDEEDEENDIEESNNVTNSVLGSEEDIFGNEISSKREEPKVQLAGYSDEQGTDENFDKPQVAGKQTQNVRAQVIATMILIGAVLLILTWTVGRKKRNI